MNRWQDPLLLDIAHEYHVPLWLLVQDELDLNRFLTCTRCDGNGVNRWAIRSRFTKTGLGYCRKCGGSGYTVALRAGAGK